MTSLLAEDCWLLVVAGGSGQRMGQPIAKQFLPLAGVPLLVHTLRATAQCIPPERTLLVLPADDMPRWAALETEFAPWAAPMTQTAGGATRSASVRAGLQALLTLLAQRALDPDRVYVGIHDGVRPCLSEALLTRAYACARQLGSAVPVVPVVPSLRQLLPDGGSQAVDRSAYHEVQTPQVFALQRLWAAYQALPAERSLSDDAGVWEALYGSVGLCEGAPENLKVTTPMDLMLAELLLTGRPS